MKDFFRKHIEQVLAAAALVFLGIIAVFFIWGITTISVDVSRVTTPAPASDGLTVFDLSGAQALNLKGLMQ